MSKTAREERLLNWIHAGQLKYGQYESRVDTSLFPGTKHYEIRDGVSEHVSTSYTEEERAANENILLQIVNAHVEKKEYYSLSQMGEYLRANGHFYWDTTPAMRETLKVLLEQANETIDNGEVFRDPHVLGIAHAVYDIVFHQISFERYGLACIALYNTLTTKIRDEKFVQAFEESKKNYKGEFFPGGHYEHCNCFIDYHTDYYERDEEDEDEGNPPPVFFHLRAFENKGEQQVLTSDILRIFEKYTIETFRDMVRLNFDEFNFGTLLIPTDQERQSFITMYSFDMPESLIRCIFQVMQLGNFVYTRSDDNKQVVLSPDVLRHKPDDWIVYDTTTVAGTWEAFLQLHDVKAG